MNPPANPLSDANLATAIGTQLFTTRPWYTAVTSFTTRKGNLAMWTSTKTTRRHGFHRALTRSAIGVALIGLSGLLSASAAETAGIPSRGPDGITESVAEIMQREAATPKPPFDPLLITARPEVGPAPPKAPLPGSLDIPHYPVDAIDNGQLWDPARSGPLQPQVVGTSIAGPGRNADGISAIPPDSIGDVGPTQVLMHVNGRIKVYDKFTGAVGGLDVTDTTFWASVSNGVGISDPRVDYDRLSGRWFLTMINVAATSNRILIAVSSGPTISNSASFTFFQITTASQFLDYDTLGVDAHALYIGGNIFTTSSGSFASTRGYVINKANLLAGSLVFTTFNNMATGTVAGPWTPQGVSNDDPAATEGYFIGVDILTFSKLQIRRVSDPGGASPTLSANLSITVPTTTFPINQTYQGVLNNRSLDALDDRLFQAQITRDVISGRSTLWAAHNIQVNAAGVGNNSGGRNGSRWYEIDNLSSTPTLLQSGTLFDSAASNPSGYWIPSAAMSSQGHMALGASSAGAARFPELWAAGRLRTDTLGTTQAPSQLQASSSTYNLEGANTVQRWGDYSKTALDPCDSQTFWHVGEYADAANSWRLRAVQLRAATPPTGATPVPGTISVGATNVSVVVNATSVSGTEFFDNPAGYLCDASCSSTGTGTCHIAASVTGVAPAGTPISINSVTFNSPTQITLNVSATSAGVGTHTVQVRNPDGQASSFDILTSATSNPSFTPAGAISRQQGSAAGAAVSVGTVTDPDTPVASLTVTQIAGGSAVGVSASGITNTAGDITAAVAASCTATAGTVRFQVSDGSLTGNGDLTVNVSANTAPTLSYAAQSVAQAGALSVNPASGPTDNGSVASIVLQSAGTYSGTIAVDNVTGVVSISNAAPVGVHTLTVRSTDNCGSFTDSSFSLDVSNTAPSFTPEIGLSRQQGSAGGAAVSVGSVSDAQTAAASLVVTSIAGGSAVGVNVTGTVNSAGTVNAVLAASCTATAGTVRFQVSDGDLSSNGDVAIAVSANTAPTLSYGAQSVAQPMPLTVSPNTGPSDNGNVTSIVVQGVGSYTGTIAVDNSTGVVSVSNPAPLGIHTITVRSTDNCGTTTDASLQLTVLSDALFSDGFE